MIDDIASYVEKLQHQNTKEEHETIKKGDIPESRENPDHKNKLRQKDADATWTKKHRKTYYALLNMFLRTWSIRWVDL